MTSTIWYKALLCLLLIGGSVVGQTADDVIQSIYNRGVYFDSERFDSTVLIDFMNDATMVIATVGHTNEATDTIALSQFLIEYDLPIDFYIPLTAVINADSRLDPVSSGSQNLPERLEYVPYSEWGRKASNSDRPKHFSTFNGRLFLDQASNLTTDTLTLEYFAYPTTITATTDSIDLPREFIPYLKDVLARMCINRLLYPDQPDKNESIQLVMMVKEVLYGRPADAD